MMRYWTDFARNGNPNGPGQALWPAFDDRDQTMLFNLQNSVATGVAAFAARYGKTDPKSKNR